MIHPCRECSHIRTAYRTPPQYRRQQCVGSRRLLPQRRDKLGGKQTGLEFSRRQIGQVDPLRQPDACRFQNINSLWPPKAAFSCQYRVLLYAKNMNISNLFHGRVYLFAICLQKSRKPPEIGGFLLEKSHSLLSIPAPAGGFPLRWPAAPPPKSRSVPAQR